MITVQNLACIEVELNVQSHRFYFREDAIPADAIIDNIILFFNDHRANAIYQIGNPFCTNIYDANNGITPPTLIADNGLYLNVSDDEKEYISNLFFKQIQAIRGNTDRVLLLNLSRKISPKNSYFNYSVNSDVRFLAYFVYTTKKLSAFNPIINGCFPVEIPLNPSVKYQDILLSDYIPSNYKNKVIKRIVGIESGYSYLYLRTERELIENIPISLLARDINKSQLWFDNLKFDYEQSFLKFRGYNSANTNKIELLFYY